MLREDLFEWCSRLWLVAVVEGGVAVVAVLFGGTFGSICKDSLCGGRGGSV